MDGRREYTVSANPARGTVKAAPGFFVVGATNPNAPGVRLSEALLSRFALHIEVTTDYDLAVELGVPSQLVAAARNLETKRINNECEWSPQLRELLATAKVSERFGPDMALRNLVGLAPENERQLVADVLANVYGREIEALAHDRNN
jgi:MoxR-like ATPase